MTTILPTLLAIFALVLPILAQKVINGQTFTNGLAIVDAPALNSPYQAGANMPIAIDLSGDGKLPQNAFLPGDGLATGYDSLEIYLVSAQTNQNITVSSGLGLLMQESGSTVKHLNYNISTCVPAGSYNLTFYEASHIDSNRYFAITPIPVQINNPRTGSPCSQGTNSLQAQPQISNPPPSSPWLATSGFLTSISTNPAAGFTTVITGGPTYTGGTVTVTVSSSGDVPWPLSSATPTTVTVTDDATTTTAPPVSVTVVIVSMETVTTTAPGQTIPTTETVTFSSTTTAVMDNNSNFVPVSSASHTSDFWISSCALAAIISGMVLVI